mgnify:CR=1 FL=1
MPSQSRRQIIEDTALKLFCEKGVSAVSVRDIAGACGIGESGLYRHMCSKEELAGRIFKRAYLEFASKLKSVHPAEGSAMDKIVAYLDVILRAHDETPDLVLFLLGGQQDILARTISKGDVTPLKIVRETIIEGMDTGEFAVSNPDLVTAMVFGATLQPLTFIRFGRIPSPAINLKPELAETLHRMLSPSKGSSQ